jgi:hypothetical protein
MEGEKGNYESSIVNDAVILSVAKDQRSEGPAQSPFYR